MQEHLRQQLELHSRYVALGSLANGRRILDLGCGSAACAEQLLQAGATHVVMCTENGAGEELGLSGDSGDYRLTKSRVVDPPLPFADGVFDLVICHDLPQRLAVDGNWVSEIRRVLVPEGYLVLAVANPSGSFLSELAGARFHGVMHYEDLRATLAPLFGTLTLYGQSPFVGSVFYDLHDDRQDPGLSLDRSLLTDDTETPGWYLLIFGPTAYHRDDIAVVQLPFTRLIDQIQAVYAHDQNREELQQLRQELAAAQTLTTQQTDALERAQNERLALESKLGELLHELNAERETTAKLQNELLQARSSAQSAEAGYNHLAHASQRLTDALRQWINMHIGANGELAAAYEPPTDISAHQAEGQGATLPEELESSVQILENLLSHSNTHSSGA